MVLHSRRRLLHVVAALLPVFAGCNGQRRESPPTATPGVPPTVDYDALVIRNPAGESFVSYGGADADADGGDAFVDELLTTAADAGRVSFSPGVDGVDEARAFLDATDFERDAVFVMEQPVAECRALDVNYVTTTADSFDIEFCTPLRPADVDCRADRRDVAAAVVRFRLSTDSVTSYSVGGGRSCRRPPREGPGGDA